MPSSPSLLFALQREAGVFCEQAERTPLFKEMRHGSLSLDRYRGFLVQMYHYLLPGANALASAARRVSDAERPYRRYLTEHAAADAELLPLLLADLGDLGVLESDRVAVGASPQTQDLIGYVDALYHDPDTVFILVSDIAGKAILARYGGPLMEAVRPALPALGKGIGFLRVITRAQAQMRARVMDILQGKITSSNEGRFLSELRIVFGLFNGIIGAL